MRRSVLKRLSIAVTVLILFAAVSAGASEAERYAPMDIFEDVFNPYASIGMPDIFTVFGASFVKGSQKHGADGVFTLSMTAKGNAYAAIAYQADVAGLGLDDAAKGKLVDKYRENGCFCELTGADGQIVTFRQADPNDDRYEYVESDGSHGISGAGIVIDITCFISEAEQDEYIRLVKDNFDTDALAPVAEYFDVSTDFGECGINVNLYKGDARAYVVYRLPDVQEICKAVQESGSNWWEEWNGLISAAFSHLSIESKLTFDGEDGAITVEQMTTALTRSGSGTATLQDLRFGFDEADLCGVYEERWPHYISVAITRPEWGVHGDGWNIEFIDTDIGERYELRITYCESDGENKPRYIIEISRDGAGARYEAIPSEGIYTDNVDGAREMLADIFDEHEGELLDAPIDYFERFVRERFGMSVPELYALPKR